MKLVLSYVKPHKLSDVVLALHGVRQVSGMTVTDARGWGRGKLEAEKRSVGEQARDFEPHARIEVACSDDLVEKVVESIRQAAHTGLSGDGKIFVLELLDAVRISSGERGEAAV